MNRTARHIDVYFLILIFEIVIVASFAVFETGVEGFVYYFFMVAVFFLTVIAYFSGIVAGLIASAFVVFGYGSYSLYQNVVSGANIMLETYIMLTALPIAAFTAGRFSSCMARLQERNLSLEKQIKNFVTVDEVTGLDNTKSFYEDLDKEISRTKRYKSELSIMIIELQYYDELMAVMGAERLNDILRQISGSIKSCLRNEDGVYKISSDSLGIIMPSTGAKGAQVVMDRMRNEFREIAVRNTSKSEKYSIDVKIGLLEYSPSIGGAFEFKELAEKELEFDV